MLDKLDRVEKDIKYYFDWIKSETVEGDERFDSGEDDSFDWEDFTKYYEDTLECYVKNYRCGGYHEFSAMQGLALLLIKARDLENQIYKLEIGGN